MQKPHDADKQDLLREAIEVAEQLAAENAVLRSEARNDNDALALLRRTYQDESLPLYIRLNAAQVAIKYETPAKATTSVVIGGGDYAARIERGRARAAAYRANLLELNSDKRASHYPYPDDLSGKRSVIEYTGEGPDTFHRVQHEPGRRESE